MKKIEIALMEYEKLKDEQVARIGYRDNMVYLTIVAIGAVCSFALSDPKYYLGLFVLPFMNFILGWMYIINDQKITSIRDYIKNQLSDKIDQQLKGDENNIFKWETVRGDEKYRIERKTIQLIVDLITFPFSSILAITAYFLLVPKNDYTIEIIIAIIEIIFILILIWQFIKYADIKKKISASS